MKEKEYNLRISESDLKDVPVKNALIKLIDHRLKLQKYKPHYTISGVEYLILKKHHSWCDVEKYAPKKADKLKGEVGKLNGKRCVVRGRK